MNDKQLEYIMDAKNDDVSSCCGGRLWNDLCSACGEHSGPEEVDFQDVEADKAYHEGLSI